MLTRSILRNFSTQGLKVFNDVAKQQFKISMFDGMLLSIIHLKVHEYINTLYLNVLIFQP